MENKSNKKAHVSEAKLKKVSELSELIKKSKTILVASIKNLPGSQFQEIVKKLRGKAEVKVPKKNLIFRAIDDSSSENKEIEKLKENIDESVAILFSDLDSFELSLELVKNKRPAKAKPGQLAPEDIEIPEGPTELVPGPAITELGALGIPIQIDKGKIHIKKAKVIAKEGEEISKQAADLMSKLNIKPFSIGFVPICAFDNEEKKLYTDIKIDMEQTLEDLKNAFGRALPFAVEIGYINDETITFMIGKAGRNEKVIESLLGKEKVEEVTEEKKMEEGEKKEVKEEIVKEKTDNDKQETSVDKTAPAGAVAGDAVDEEKTETAEEPKVEEKKEDETQTETKSEEEK